MGHKSAVVEGTPSYEHLNEWLHKQMPNHNEANRGQIVDNGLDPNENVPFL